MSFGGVVVVEVMLNIQKIVDELCSTDIKPVFAKGDVELELSLSSPGICCAASMWELANSSLLAGIEGLIAMKVLGDHLAHGVLAAAIRQSCRFDAKKSLSFLNPECIVGTRQRGGVLSDRSSRSRVASMVLDHQRWATGHDWVCA